jgi:outer membrane protein OmpA-like peptidoglycan-associated protein
MKTIANVVAVAAAVVVLGGCSYNVDTGPLEGEIAKAKAGPWGTCYTHIHAAAEALDEAEKGLAFIKRINGSYGQPYMDKAMANVSKAMEARNAADVACHTRVAALEAEMPGIKAALDDHDKRISTLENAHSLMQGVTFHTGSSKLTPPAKTALNVIANILLRNPTNVEIAGHASTPGTPEMNMRLSQRRASTVRSYLMGLGIHGGRLSAKGYGETELLVEDRSSEGRRANQRVELKF